MSAPSGRAGGVEDGSGQRRGFFDRTSRHHGSSDTLREQTPPTIRVHTSPPPGLCVCVCVCVCVCERERERERERRPWAC